MSIGANLIMWGSLIWCPWLVYFLLVNEAKPKKNIIVGVTFPHHAQSDPQLLQILAAFKREMRLVVLLLTAVTLPCLFIKSMGVGMTVWMVWMIAACLVPNVPYIRCNKTLKTLKAQRGWGVRPSRPRAAVDLAAAVEVEEMKWLSFGHFLPPALISLIPFFFDRELWLLWLTMSAMVLLFYVIYRWGYRNRAEMVDDNTRRTVLLTRIRRNAWGRAWLLLAWASGLLNPLIWLTLDHIWLNMAVFFGYTVFLLALVMRIEFGIRAQQEKLCADSGENFYVDEDDYWIWGMLYYNPNDSRFIVNNRVGINSSINLARPAGKVMMAITALILAAMPLIGVWLMDMERAPLALAVTETELTAAHFHKEYELALEDIAAVELVEQLPAMTRVGGTALPAAYTGKWNAQAWGRFNCCIDPRQGPWLLVETDNGTHYLFGGGENTDTRQIYAMLTE